MTPNTTLGGGPTGHHDGHPRGNAQVTLNFPHIIIAVTYRGGHSSRHHVGPLSLPRDPGIPSASHLT